MASVIVRAGRYVKQPRGYHAFIPAPLPPEPPLEIAGTILTLLSQADQALGRLDGVTQTLPNPNLFVAVYVRREAVLSSKIEGTQSTLDDVLEFEMGRPSRRLPQDVEEVVNYVRAMNSGLERLRTLPLSLRLIREIHGELLENVRGADRRPGEFRTSQNWIGEANAPMSQATFIPPPAPAMLEALDNFEKFLHQDHHLPDLIVCALAHAQFETIHPFIDGNGRLGRLLITFLLCQRGVLERPLLYLSYFLNRHRSQYYDRLTAIREEGNWEDWVRFFLQGVSETAREATATARAIVHLREANRLLIQERGMALNALRLLDLLFQAPILNVSQASTGLDVAFVTANHLVEQLVDLGLLNEITGGQRNRVYRYTPYLSLFEDEDILPESEEAPIQATAAIPD